MIQKNKSLEIIYDNLSYSSKQFDSILNEFTENEKDEIELKELHQKAFGEFPTIILLFLSNIGIWFSKGFFTKCGEKIAEILFEKISDNKPVLGLTFSQNNKPKVNIVIKSDNKNQLKNSLTNIKIREIYEGVLEYVQEKLDNDIIEITVVFDGELKTIIRFYYIDKKNDVYVGTKLQQ